MDSLYVDYQKNLLDIDQHCLVSRVLVRGLLSGVDSKSISDKDNSIM